MANSYIDPATEPLVPSTIQMSEKKWKGVPLGNVDTEMSFRGKTHAPEKTA